MFEIITGKIGSGKMHLAFSQVLKPGFIDYQQFYLVSPELSKKENIFSQDGIRE